MKKPSIKAKRGNTKKKTKWREWLITALAIVCVGGAMTWIVYSAYTQPEPIGGHRMALPSPGVVLDPKKVCMASNVYMGSAQFSVNIQGKDYYSCSELCTGQLHSSENVRVAKDPYTHQPVFKCQAYITMSPDSAGTILYFETRENIKKYLAKQ